jgi:SAM-dependent methyltransferase
MSVIEKKDRLLSKRFLASSIDAPLPSQYKEAITELQDIFSGHSGERKPVSECACCGSDVAYKIAEKDRYGIFLETLVCEQCGFIFSGEHFSDDFSGKYYSTYANIFKNNGKSPEFLFDQRTKQGAYCWTRRNYVEQVLGKKFEAVKQVVEVGCNDGCNLYPYHIEGKATVGLDFDEARLAAGRSKGMTMLRGSLQDLPEGQCTPGLVILSHLVEHLSDLDVFFTDLYERLQPGSYIYVEVPGYQWAVKTRRDIETVDNYTGSNDLLPYLQLEHNYCFNLSTLRTFVERAGFFFIEGDEIVRAVFAKPEESSEKNLKPFQLDQRGETVLQYFSSVEKNYQREFMRRLARRIYRGLKRYA